MNKDNYFKSTIAIILAGGEGKRIGSHLPKVLYPIVGKPMLYYTLEMVNKIPIEKIIVVVGFSAIDVIGSIRNEKVKFVYQKERLGTAHAVRLVLSKVPKDTENLIVINGDDSAFFEVLTVRDFIQNYRKENSKLSFITSQIENPLGYGRVIRNEESQVTAIVEEKDTPNDQKEIKEVNTGCYLFDYKWLSKNINQVTKSKSGEYYITDLVSIALKQGIKILDYPLKNPDEWQGINTKKELKIANRKKLSKLIDRKKPTVFIFDIDNTLLNTDGIKRAISEVKVPELFKCLNPNQKTDNLIKIFWSEYEKTRKDLGYVSIPDFAERFAKRVRNPKYATEIRKLFYSLSFEDYVFSGVDELMEFIDPKGEIAIFTEGDLVYQPMKIKNLEFSKYIDEIFVFEKWAKNIKIISKIYQNYRKFIFDDKITVLEAFKTIDKKIVTVHVKQGIYKDLQPKDSGFKADFTAKDISKVVDFIRERYY